MNARYISSHFIHFTRFSNNFPKNAPARAIFTPSGNSSFANSTGGGVGVCGNTHFATATVSLLRH